MALDLLRWALVLIGFVYLVTDSAIFMKVRLLVSRLGTYPMVLIYCPSCIGFWVGVALGVGGLWPLDTFNTTAPWWEPTYTALVSGVAGMAVAQTWNRMTGGTTAFEVEEDLRKLS